MTASRRADAGATSRTQVIGGLRSRVLATDGAGPPVLLVHGFSDSADGWREVMAVLAAEGRRAVAIDLPHHGRAARPPTDSLLAVVRDFVAAAVEDIDTGEGVLLVGNSVAALAALQLAQRPPTGLAGVVALAPAGVTTTWWLRALVLARPVLRPLVAAELPTVLRGTVTGPALIANGFASAVSRGRMSPTARAQYASHWGPGDLRRQLRLGGTTIDELTRPDVLRADRFVVPVTLVYGDRDWVCPPRGADAVRHQHPDVEVVTLLGTGHCPQYDCPEMVAGTVIDVLDSRIMPRSNIVRIRS